MGVMERITRRALIVGSAAAGVAAVGGAWRLSSEGTGGAAHADPASATPPKPSTTAPDPARWIVEENAKLMRSLADTIAPACGGDLGVPAFYNEVTKKAICGRIDLAKLVAWAKG